MVSGTVLDEAAAKAKDLLNGNVKIGEELPPDYGNDDASDLKPARRCGILMHPSSLPGDHGIGDFGAEAFLFLDWLHSSGCSVWQVLPLVPTGEDLSPYFGTDANCGNTLFISLQELVKGGLLEECDVPAPVPVERLQRTAAVAELKEPVLAKATKKLVSMCSGPLKEEFETFKRDSRISVWLEDSALFNAIDGVMDTKYWWDWPSDLRDRNAKSLETARKEHREFIDHFMAAQFLFQRQWQALHKYANSLGIKIVGDMSIYVGPHSTDVWAHRRMFELDPMTGTPLKVSGVPPDGFCTEGQLWGSPLYNWKEMAKDRYSWWVTRMRRAFDLFDEFRIDHFRGLAGYWAVNASAKNAMHGKWLAGPRTDFFTAIQNAVGKVDIIAEDLGIITKDVVALRKRIQAPGMAVLEFAFNGDPTNPHLPHNHEVDQVVYTGTHDNETVVEWWKRTDESERSRVQEYFRFQGDKDVHWELIRGALSSVALTAILPLQDIIGLDKEARMNTPGTNVGNWQWRVGDAGVFAKLEKEKLKLQQLNKFFNRFPTDAEAKL